MNVISSSYGNDSVALIQWAHENGVEDVTVCYIDTGWAGIGWDLRVEKGEAFARACGFGVVRIRPEVQFEELMKLKKGFPNQRFQWCSAQLKGIPFLNWIDEQDPHGHAVVMVGKRREESEARANTPCMVLSEYHGGRVLVHPLYMHADADRDALLARAGFDPLPHRSRECDPCVNANSGDFRRLEWADIEKAAALEAQVGKTMFRPARHNGAQGVREVVRWAKYGQGKYSPDQDDLFDLGCGSPFGCGL